MMSSVVPLTAPGLRLPHGFFTRQGGVSLGPYARLNCSTRSADDPAAVQQNRALAARAIGADPAHLVGINQVHGTAVLRVRTPLGQHTPATADGSVTRQPGVALAIITADCAPVLFADREAGVIGAAHAGWRGALAGILEATLAAMQELGARLSRIQAAIGPAIGPRSYEVGPDLHDAVLRRSPADRRFFALSRHDGHWLFDLPGYCRARLLTAGLSDITTIAADTAADEERFFSHRRRSQHGGGPIGHQVSLIMLPPV